MLQISTGEEQGLPQELEDTWDLEYVSAFLGDRWEAFDQDWSPFDLSLNFFIGLWKCQPRSGCHFCVKLSLSVRR